jgi:glutaredoxin-like protein NrdH
MEMTHVEGENRGKVMLYALSTCVWCKRTKRLLNELGVEYYFIDVDLLGKKAKDKVVEEVKKYNPVATFPTTVINEKKVIRGYKPEEIRKELER